MVSAWAIVSDDLSVAFFCENSDENSSAKERKNKCEGTGYEDLSQLSTPLLSSQALSNFSAKISKLSDREALTKTTSPAEKCSANELA